MRRLLLALGVVIGLLLIISGRIIMVEAQRGNGNGMAGMGPKSTHPAGGGGGKIRVYYIAADTVRWNYAPSGRNMITGQPFDEVARTYTQRTRTHIGSVYYKARYQEYTDSTFLHLKPIPLRWSHLGILGPVIHAEVGDTIIVHFKNHTKLNVDMHPHGVFYKKDSEGAPYNDGTSGKDKLDDIVPPGGSHTYVWQVPERAGPGPMDGSSIMWMYHSHVDEPRDTNAGLVGPIIVTKRGMARPDGSPKDVDREFITLFSIFNENLSWYLPQNITTFAPDARRIKEGEPEEGEFEESNLKHSINGYLFGNMPLMTMHKGERVRWYVMGMGTETDLHTPHWHGQTVLANGMRTDVVNLLPMSMVVADMTPDDPGIWLYHCHVNDHIRAGMLARFRVLP